VVPAGGAGTRLWPLSRAARPKFLLDLTGSGRSLLQQTVDRLAPLVGDRVLVVTGVPHRDAVLGQLPHLPDAQVVAEPSPRDSMAAIGLAAAILERDDPRAVLGSFAADQVITGEDSFRSCVQEAVDVARSGLLVTVGIQPTHPATGFGYIRSGAPLEGRPSARRVEEFVEKPDAERARAYVEDGRHRWNAGMFVVQAGVLLDLLAENHPELAAGLREVDLVMCSGGVRYIGERSFDRILGAVADPSRLWLATFVLRVFDYAPIAGVLARHGLVTERLPGTTFPQRRFADRDEAEAALHDVVARGLDPSGKEADGWYHADCFVSRPAGTTSPFGALAAVRAGSQRRGQAVAGEP
jgi:mannose-1-phosphate guanylyltransferase